MKAKRYIPERGDIVWLEFNPKAGHEQAGHRPALVLSPRIYNEKTHLALFCPITSQIKGYPFEVSLQDNQEVKGVILADQIKNFDWRARKARLAAQASPQIIGEVLAKINSLLS